MGTGNGTIPRRKLGKTGIEVSAIAMGGIVVMNLTQSEADRIVRWAYENGVNYFDVAPTYGNAEERLGPALKGLRDKVFLACKTEKRDRQGAAEAIRQSLKRLQTDHFDLYQLHAIRTKEDVEQVFGLNGAMEAILEAKEQGLIRFLGFSAHSEEAALMALDRYQFDTVMLPVNFVSMLKNGFGQKVLEKVKAMGTAVIAIKAMAKTYWNGERKLEKCWYEPITEREQALLTLRFTLSQQNVVVAVPPGDERLFQMAVELGKNYRPIEKDELSTLKEIADPLTPLFPLRD
ncbi:MAG: aldo/keto reductase [Armatimonadetes bacterium]|nr:aldo/keto reductase [Armatimonadota bacterium]MDW8027685.1 aldo/keto reductase [Armatimonadota bacterium]